MLINVNVIFASCGGAALKHGVYFSTSPHGVGMILRVRLCGEVFM